MKYLVTGGSGFIGSAVVRKALDLGDEVINLDALTYAASLKTLDQVETHPAYTFYHLDIRDRAAMIDVFEKEKPDAVIHLAAESHVDRSIDGPASFVDTNIVGTFTLLDVARLYCAGGHAPQGFRLLHVSTDEVYGSLGPSGRFHESSPYDPRSPYSASKAASDHLVRAWGHTYDLPVIVTNCSNNFGPYQFPEKLIPVVILNALKGADIPVYGQGANVRDWLFVDDHAEALLKVIKEGQPGETYLIGGENERTNLELVRAICGIMDQECPGGASYAGLIRFVSDRPGHDRRYAIDPSETQRRLGWQAKTPFDEGLLLTVRWYLDNRDWWEPLLDRDGVGARLGRR
ncbi:MAG: dTDP-glucose 4,6-dehydratase [Pseudomonadota bacterium]